MLVEIPKRFRGSVDGVGRPSYCGSPSQFWFIHLYMYPHIDVYRYVFSTHMRRQKVEPKGYLRDPEGTARRLLYLGSDKVSPGMPQFLSYPYPSDNSRNSYFSNECNRSYCSTREHSISPRRGNEDGERREKRKLLLTLATEGERSSGLFSFLIGKLFAPRRRSRRASRRIGRAE